MRKAFDAVRQRNPKSLLCQHDRECFSREGKTHRVAWANRLRAGLSRLRDHTRGVAVLEFALVSTPFFLLLFATFQTGLLFFEQQVLQTAVTDASRLIFTGQAQATGLTQAQFKQTVCSRLPAFIACGSVAVDVRTQDSFADAEATMPVDGTGKYDPDKVVYLVGAQKQVVVVSAFVVQPILFPAMSSFMSSAGSGKALLSASAAFRNEPWAK